MSSLPRPASTDITALSAEALVEQYRRRQLSPVEVTRATLDRIARLDPHLRAFLHVDEAGAMAQARASQAAWQADAPRGPLEGVPVSIKDLLDVRGLPTTAGSLVHQGEIAPADSIATERLRAAGAVILGKTNTPEFGLAPFTANRLGEPCRNPWDSSRSAGGSSGGAAAAAAAGFGPLHVGTDGGGSIRIPAAFCGVFGLKPTYGRVPRSGMSGMPMFSHTGPITRTVADAALMLDVMAGPDPRDVTAIQEPPPSFRAALDAPLGQPRVAFCPAAWGVSPDPEIAALVQAAARDFAALGCAVEEVSAPPADWREIFTTIMFSDEYTAAEHLLPARAADLAPYTQAIMRAAQRITVPQYSRALRALEAFRFAVRRLFADHDLMLLPVTALPPFAIGPRPDGIPGQDADTLGRGFPYTAQFNLTGQPAAALPCGFTAAGLPVSLQVAGRWGDEAAVLRACAAYQSAHPWKEMLPPL